MNLSRPADRRRAVALAVLACLSLGSAVGLAGGLVSCTPADEPAEARPLSAAEAQRLASMRLVNYRDKRAGIEARYGKGDATVRMTGWVDWTRSLVYLNVGGPGAGAERGLLQAVPGILATRPATPRRRSGGDPAVDTAVDAPPVTPPADGWRIRAFNVAGPKPAPLESFLALLFTVATDRTDAADVLEHSESRWLGTDKLAGTEVDVLLGPAVPPREVVPAGTAAPRVDAPSPTPTALAKQSAAPTGSPTPAPSALAQMGGGVRYWIDASSRMHRFEALLRQRRAGRGRPQPDRQPGVRRRGRVRRPAGRGARGHRRGSGRAGPRRAAQPQPGRRHLDLTVPTMPAANLRGAGWIDWKKGTAYVSVRDLDNPADVALMRADREGVAVLPTGPAPTPGRRCPRRPATGGSTSGGSTAPTPAAVSTWTCWSPRR